MPTRALKSFALLLLLLIVCVGCLTAPPAAAPLARLLKTTTSCRVRLQPAWVGDANYTIRTGFFTNADSPEAQRLDRELRFDWYSYSHKQSYFHFGPATISKSEGDDGESAIHTFRTSLPTDAELASAKTVSALERLLGPSQGWTDGWGKREGEMSKTAGWDFFTLKDETTIETVTVFCMVSRLQGEVEWRVESMKVIRGTAKPEQR